MKRKARIADQTLRLKTDKFIGSGHLRIGLTPQLALVGGVSQGFRAPNMEDFFGRVDFFSEIPNTSLEPEESFNWEVGFKYDNGQTTGDVYYFQSDYDGLIERVTVGTNADGSPIQQRKNVKDARIRGVEAGLTHHFNPHWFVATTLGWTEGEDRDTGDPLRRIPPLNGTLRVRYSPNEKGWIELETLLADRQDELSQGDIDDPRIPDGGTPGYTVLNLKGGYHRTPNEQLLLTLENLGDHQYKNHGSGLYAPGRSVVVSYRVDFD
jgi:outer membrane receptor protein involved in Fe transport